ncbi:DHS-like NAD/FAD-binding domain-containing protein [Patellaria atrata CBS 101060]|uniref:DHS-like NAD/FAD-binding domain-containing protein n=1 Tax=Patellaria atrata CBS 101060 TaxID=1346257 RepID=A0A9P4S861_9PEZI|nr:DHS-like NAD/FAD-binding domain-containing protein [Patellaria atrata CBS 101060]
MGLMRVPYTSPLPLPTIIPRNANTLTGAVAALYNFFTAPPSHQLKSRGKDGDKTVLLTGAGISVASGLADYRGTNGTYTLNKTYRPIYFHEFTNDHEARKRYWARSFLGWTNLERARPNRAHHAVGMLGERGWVSKVITQNVDSFHPLTHPSVPTIELHGYLRSLICLTCRSEYPRSQFQTELSRLNPTWAEFLAEMLASGALTTENPEERKKKGLKTNPDGDVDIPNAPYSTFRYPACPVCLQNSPVGVNGNSIRVDIDLDGAWATTSTGGILKPAVVMFGENIPTLVKTAAESAVDESSRILVVGSSLATYSAWRLVKRATENGMPVGIVNLGGVRGEETFFANVPPANTGRFAVRCSEKADLVLETLVKLLERGK